MRTKQQVALAALEKALQITGVQHPKRDDEFTTIDYAKAINMSEQTARRILDKHVKAGQFILRKTGKGNFYSIA